MLQATDDLKIVNHKINNTISFTVEHLLSYDSWKNIKRNNWIGERKQNEMFGMFSNVVNMSKSLNCVIDEVVDNKDLKETIVRYVPKDGKKNQILNYIKHEVKAGNTSVLDGFRNTITVLEKEFV